MDKGMYEQLLGAVDVCHASTSSQEERNAAYSYCEQFQSRADCVSYAFFILQTSGHANHHRHFALHVLELWLRTHWKTISQDDIVSYRTSLLTVVASHLTQDEPSYIKEKLVRVLADIAKRQFPQRWPDLLDQLMQLWRLGSVQVEIVMLLFRSIAEDCVSSSFNSTIPPTRRKDILQGLNACFNALFPQVYQQLEYQYAALQQPASDLQKQANAVLLAALQMMKEFLDWMPVATAAAPDTNFIAVASLMLVAPQLSVNLRIAAAECLEVFFSRNFGKENLTLLVAASESCWAHLGQIPLNVNEVDDNDELMLHMHINRILVSWGTHQLELLLGEFPASQEVLAPFVQLLAVLYRHPSLQITEAQVIVWLNILKQTKIVNALLLQHIIPLLWTTSVEKYFKLNSPDRESANATSQLEFEDHEAYTTFFSNFRGRIYGILRLLIQLQPDVGLAQLHNRLEFVLTQYPRGTDALNELGHCTELSTAHLYHEGIISLTDCIMKSLPEHALTIEANLNQLKLTVELMLCYQTTDPWLLFRHCLGLSLFSKYYMRDTSMYPRVFERLFGLIVFCQPGETIHGTMDPTTMNVRRRALASLVSICHASPSHVLPFLNILCTKVISLFPVVLDSESVLMYEMLVLVSNSLPTTEERHNFIAQITAEPLATWTSPEMTRLVSSGAELVRSIESQDDSLVFGIVKVLTTLYGIAKRIQTDPTSAHPFTTVWPVLLPNLLALLRTLHCLPLERAAILSSSSSSVRGLLCMSQEEVVQAVVGKEQVPPIDTQLLRYARWSKNVRDIVYHLLGCALSLPSFYDLVDVNYVSNIMEQAVMVNMEVIEHRYWKSYLSSIWLPFIKGCPEKHFNMLLQPIVLGVLTHLNTRLTPAWNPNVAANAVHFPTLQGLEMQTTTVETVQNAIILEVVRNTMDFIEALVDAKTVVDVDSDRPKHVVQEKDRILRDFVLSSMPLTHALVNILMGVLTWTDTLSARRSASILDRLVTLVYLNPALGELIGKDIFTAALTSLLHHFYDVDDGLKWELVNLLRNIYCRTTLGLLPVDECKGIDPLHQPLKPDDQINPWPRHILLGLHGVEPGHIIELEAALRQHPSLKSQKNLLKEFVESPFLAYRDAPHTFKAIEDLPESLVVLSKVAKEHEKATLAVDVSTSSLYQ